MSEPPTARDDLLAAETAGRTRWARRLAQSVHSARLPLVAGWASRGERRHRCRCATLVIAPDGWGRSATPCPDTRCRRSSRVATRSEACCELTGWPVTAAQELVALEAVRPRILDGTDGRVPRRVQPKRCRQPSGARPSPGGRRASRRPSGRRSAGCGRSTRGRTHPGRTDVRARDLGIVRNAGRPLVHVVVEAAA